MTTERLKAVADILADGIRPTGERHKVVRIGQRDPIPNHIRSAVWYRDQGRCELCADGVALNSWHLDHVIPWSAGGSDDSTNLRVLCERHNVERGNAIDPTERPKRAVTWWCVNCFGEDNFWDWTANGLPICPRHNFNFDHCRVITGYRRIRDIAGEMPNWHMREPIWNDAPLSVAYCAHCNRPGLTDRPL